ncbi:MAG: DUF1573 domain-containing protein [Acidobacteriota bacterium]
MSSRRIALIVPALVLALSTGTSVMAQNAADKAPRLTVVEPLKDFGTVAKGEKLDWSFLIKNTGDADLKIVAARPSCGCTVADFDKEIKPGQTGKVTAHVDTTAFAGPISKAVTVESNDPNNPSAQLTIHAIVKPYVEAFPAGFLRYNIVQGDAQTQAVTIYSAEETTPFQILKAEVPGDWVKVDYKKIDKAEDMAKAGAPGQVQYKVSVTVGGPTVKVGPLADKIRLVTNSKHQPEYFLSLSGVVRPTYSVIPSVVNFGEVTANDPTAERNITLRSNDTHTPGEFKVTKVESSSPDVTAQIKPTDQAGEYQVTARVAPGAKAGQIDGTIKIFTSDPLQPVYTLPIKAMVKAAAKPGE